MFQAELCHLSCVTLVARFLKGVHFSVTLFNVGSVGAIMLMAMVEMMGQGSCIPPCGLTRSQMVKRVICFPAILRQYEKCCSRLLSDLQIHPISEKENPSDQNWTFAGNFCSSSVFWHLRHRSAPSFLLNTQILYHIHEESRIQIWSNVHRRHFSRFFSLLLCSLRRPTRSQITKYLDLQDSVFGLTNISIFQSKIFPYFNQKYFHI